LEDYFAPGGSNIGFTSIKGVLAPDLVSPKFRPPKLFDKLGDIGLMLLEKLPSFSFHIEVMRGDLSADSYHIPVTRADLLHGDSSLKLDPLSGNGYGSAPIITVMPGRASLSLSTAAAVT
jgi:hypothetical protein